MAIGNRTATSGDISSTTGTTTITKPTGSASTDILIAVFGNDDAAVPAFTTTAPSGWTRVGTTQAVNVGASTAIRLDVFWAPGNVASTAFTNSASGKQQGWVCQAFTGVDNTTPIDATGTGSTNTSSATISAGAVTIATSGALEVIAYAPWDSGTVTATGFTVASNSGANAGASLLWNATPKSTGSTGTVTVSNAFGSSGQFQAAQPFALRPDSSGGPTTNPAAALLLGI